MERRQGGAVVNEERITHISIFLAGVSIGMTIINLIYTLKETQP